MGETYASLAAGPFEIALGWQRLTLDQGEVFSYANVANPRDLRDVGLIDPEYVTLPVAMSRLSLSLGGHRLQALVVHQAFYGVRAPPLGELSPLRALLEDSLSAFGAAPDKEWRARDVPNGFAPNAWQALGVYSVSTGAFDLAFYGGSVLDPFGVAQLPRASALRRAEIELSYYHPRYTLIVHAGSWAVSEILLRWELAAEVDRPQATRSTTAPILQIGMERNTQVGGLIGLTYFGIEGLNLGIELRRDVVLDKRAPADSTREWLLPIEAEMLAARVMYSLLNESVQLSLFGMWIGLFRVNGIMARADLSYTWTAGWKVGVGYVCYRPSADFGPFYGFNRSDRLFVDLRWDFTLM
jgi:hypothetical protein